MYVLLINIDRSSERLTYMTNLLNNAGIPFQRIPAVDGKKLTPEIIKKHQATDSAHLTGMLQPSQIGCFLSHRLAWQALADSDHECALILEDDLSISDDLPKFINDHSWLPNDADIVKLEFFNEKKIWLDSKALQVENARTLYKLRSAYMGTGAYVIMSNEAEKLLIETSNFLTPVDHVLFNEERVNNSNTYQMIPALVRQHSINNPDTSNGIFASTIDGNSVKKISKTEQSNIFTSKIMREIRRVNRKFKALVTEYTGIGKTIRKSVTFK